MSAKGEPVDSERPRILFVCTGNICRSPLAEALLRRKLTERGAASRFEIDSVGTTPDHLGQEADPRMRGVAAARGTPFTHRSRRLSAADLAESDLVLAMDGGHYHYVKRRAAESAGLLRMFRAYDPEVGSRAGANRGDSDGGPDHIPDVPDPWYGSMRDFREVYEIVDRTCEALADLLAGGGVGRAE